VAPLCWLAVALEGFDLVELGVVIPALLKEPGWDLTPNSAATIASVGLVGVMVGAMAVGAITDVIGRRRTVVWTVVIFSVLTLACAFAPNPFAFGLLRFLAGIGLGGVLPTAIAMVNEFAPQGRGGTATTTMMTGYHAGAVVAALIGILIIEPLGWRSMFVAGALPALVLVPLILRYLPESRSFLRTRGEPPWASTPAAAGGSTPADAPVPASSVTAPRPASGLTGTRPANPVSALFRHGLTRSTVAFSVTSVLGLLLVYGLNTWLPQIMRDAGYQLGAALALLLVLNVGAVIGLLIAGRVADRIGNRRSTVAWFVLAAVFLAVLSIKLPGFGVYASVLLAGVFAFSAQVLVYAYVSHIYPTSARGTALGTASAVGRLGAIAGPLLGGALLTAGIAYPWGFYIFAAVAAVGAVCIAMVNRDPAPDEPLPDTADEAAHAGQMAHR
jgi:benzoate transport